MTKSAPYKVSEENPKRQSGTEAAATEPEPIAALVPWRHNGVAQVVERPPSQVPKAYLKEGWSNDHKIAVLSALGLWLAIPP